ncbi:MAG: YIP1 family protein [Clostridia bacterium]|nr:YIP1 family protein [Clostridia bacterium]
MKKFNKILCTFFALLMVASAFCMVTGASSAYQTYVYDVYGDPLYSPDAYTAITTVDSDYMGLMQLENPVAIENPGDMVTDDAQNVYIADTGNNRIVVLDRYYKYNFIIDSFDNDQGVPDKLTAPQGVFVSEANETSPKLIWVCDTGANRIVVFDEFGKFVRIIEEPESSLFDQDSVYKPVAMAVDEYNRLYVVSSTTYQGIIVMTSDGTFTGFIGAQAVSMSAWEIIWRRFQTAEQRAASEQKVSTEFNNITINKEKGLVYVTTSTIDEAAVSGAIRGGDKTGTNSPVKLLNANGAEIMRRNGFWIPAGEVDFSQNSTDEITGVSTIIDAAVGPENTWSIIDEKRNRIYTYDFDGNLLFAFGDNGTMLGNLGSIEAIAYQNTNMLILDKTNDNITVFQRTEYGDILLSAIAAESTQDFDLAINLWTDVLKRNSNFDSAYVGIGQAMYRNKDYANSLSYFEAAYDTTNWSNSYKEIRKEWMSTYFLVMLLIIVVLIVGVSLFFKWMAKINKRVATSGKKRTFGQEIAFGFHVILHPFDGFWDLKHEKRGSVRGAVFFIVLAIATFYYQAIGQGYLLDPFANLASIWGQVFGVIVPLFLFVLANWCLTTLFDGEGSFKDIFVAAGYCLLPIPLLVIPTTIYSNFCITTEVDIIGFISTFAFIWLGLLLFFGTMVTHDYSMGKNVITIIGTIIGMVFIMFLAVLFTTLVGKIVSLITNIVDEIQYRL